MRQMTDQQITAPILEAAHKCCAKGGKFARELCAGEGGGKGMEKEDKVVIGELNKRVKGLEDGIAVVFSSVEKIVERMTRSDRRIDGQMTRVQMRMREFMRKNRSIFYEGDFKKEN